MIWYVTLSIIHCSNKCILIMLVVWAIETLHNAVKCYKVIIVKIKQCTAQKQIRFLRLLDHRILKLQYVHRISACFGISLERASQRIPTCPIELHTSYNLSVSSKGKSVEPKIKIKIVSLRYVLLRNSHFDSCRMI